MVQDFHNCSEKKDINLVRILKIDKQKDEILNTKLI